MGRNLFITGPAGVGKSFLVKTLIRRLQERPPPAGAPEWDVVLTAPTGLAAVNIAGMTVHSWAGIGLGHETVPVLCDKIMRNQKSGACVRWTKAHTLVIDEVSMLSAALLWKLDQIGRVVRRNSTVPFGGIQVIVIGDFFQLPPVPEKTAVCPECGKEDSNPMPLTGAPKGTVQCRGCKKVFDWTTRFAFEAGPLPVTSTPEMLMPSCLHACSRVVDANPFPSSKPRRCFADTSLAAPTFPRRG